MSGKAAPLDPAATAIAAAAAAAAAGGARIDDDDPGRGAKEAEKPGSAFDKGGFRTWRS